MNLVVTTEDKLAELIDVIVSNAFSRITKFYEDDKEKEKYFNLEELQNYLPDHPAAQTVYGWVNNRKIPYHKFGSKLYFKKSEIDKWVENARVMSHLKED